MFLCADVHPLPQLLIDDLSVGEVRLDRVKLGNL